MKPSDESHFGERFTCRSPSSPSNLEGFGKFCRKMSHTVHSPDTKRVPLGETMKNIPSLISQMTLEEKAALCTGATPWSTTPVERLGIPELIVSDGPHGLRRVPDLNSMIIESLPATCFPT